MKKHFLPFIAITVIIISSGCADGTYMGESLKISSQYPSFFNKKENNTEPQEIIDTKQEEFIPISIFPGNEVYGNEQTGKVRLLNIEISNKKLIKLNFIYDSISNNPYINLSIDAPTNTTHVLNSLGQKYSLLQSTGLSPERSVKIYKNGSRNFSLIFQLPTNSKYFKYQALLKFTCDNNSWANNIIRIQSKKDIYFSDFTKL
jgi:hypothetical protein